MSGGVVKEDDVSAYPICSFLKEAGISFELYSHPPVFTVQEGLEIMRAVPGHGTKNLFLRDKKGERFLLVTVCEEKRVDLNTLGTRLGIGRLSFGSPEKMREFLGIEPGSVTLLALGHDSGGRVSLYVDEDLYRYERIQSHPLRNDASLVIAPAAIDRFAAALGRAAQRVAIPTV